ncbi:hypothetical protein RSOL_045550, partial [Rhizoctonia solani AG-3 Rhs1AP]
MSPRCEGTRLRLVPTSGSGGFFNNDYTRAPVISDPNMDPSKYALTETTVKAHASASSPRAAVGSVKAYRRENAFTAMSPRCEGTRLRLVPTSGSGRLFNNVDTRAPVISDPNMDPSKYVLTETTVKAHASASSPRAAVGSVKAHRRENASTVRTSAGAFTVKAMSLRCEGTRLRLVPMSGSGRLFDNIDTRAPVISDPNVDPSKRVDYCSRRVSSHVYTHPTWESN